MPKCKYCGIWLNKRREAFDHMEKKHGDILAQEGLTPAQATWLCSHDSLHGKCNCCPECTEVTDWNEKTGKPYRISSNPACRKRVHDKVSQNMIKVYGTDNLLADMDFQKSIIQFRKISGKYRFPDGGEIGYVGALERNWLQFCDKVMDFKSWMIQDPPEYFPYYDPKENRNRMYIPDFYLPDYNLIVEIKDGGKVRNTNPAFMDTTGYKVPLKDEVMKKQDRYNYIRIRGTNYGPFVELLYRIVHEQAPDGKKRNAMIVLMESACIDPEEAFDEQIDFDRPEIVEPSKVVLMIGYIPHTNIPSYIAITGSSSRSNWYVSDLQSQEIFYASQDDPIFDNSEVRLYRYAGDHEKIQQVVPVIVNAAEKEVGNVEWDISRILSASSIMLDDGSAVTNNDQRRMDFIMTDQYFATVLPREEDSDD